VSAVCRDIAEGIVLAVFWLVVIATTALAYLAFCVSVVAVLYVLLTGEMP
jgi:hypothetical protein